MSKRKGDKVYSDKTTKKIQIVARAKEVFKKDDGDAFNKFYDKLDKLSDQEKNSLHNIFKIMVEEEIKPDLNNIPPPTNQEDKFNPKSIFRDLRFNYEHDKLTYDEYITNPQICFKTVENIRDLEGPSFMNEVKNYKKMKQKMNYFEFIFLSRIVAICDHYSNNKECEKEADTELKYLKNKYGLLIGETYLRKMKITYSRLYEYQRLACVFDMQAYSTREIVKLADYLKLVPDEDAYWRNDDEINETFEDENLVAQSSSLTISSGEETSAQSGSTAVVENEDETNDEEEGEKEEEPKNTKVHKEVKRIEKKSDKNKNKKK